MCRKAAALCADVCELGSRGAPLLAGHLRAEAPQYKAWNRGWLCSMQAMNISWATCDDDYAGRQVVSTEAMNRSSVAAYDQAGQLVASKTPNASGVSLGATALGYDLDGNLTSSTPASGNRATTYTYDALGRLITQTDPVSATDQVTISYGYDAAGNRTRYTDGRGNSTTYTVNTLGLPEKVIEPSTTAHPALADRTWTASYDAAGNAVSLLSPGGVTRTRVFDAAGRLQTETGANAEAPTTARNLTYDLDGRLATSSALDGVNTYAYNDRGLLLRADGPSGTSTQGYDPDGQLTQRIDAAGTADYTYVNGRPATVTDPVTRVLQTLGYNAAGQLASIDYGSGRVRTIGYDPYGRMNSDVLKAGTTSVSSITYGYDADNNITSKNTTGVAGAGNNTYAYDQLGRLTSWTKGPSTTTYGWDADSNRTKVTTSAGTKLTSYDERNRLLDDGTSTYTYSPRGALLTQTTGTTTEAFSFDAFDRMITRSARDFTYDALDRPVQAGTARMRYDGFSDEVVSDGTQFFGRSASDGLLAVGYDTTKRLVLADRHGDVFAGFDPTDTTLSAGLPDSRTYDPFGNSTSATGLKYRVGYQGDWTDPRSGDINEGARWYTPSSGTFNTQDTITTPAGAASSVLNLYAYAAGNPLTYNDPDGHSSVDPGDGGGNCTMKTIGWKGPEIPIQVMVCVKPCTLTNTCTRTPPPVTPPTDGCKGSGCDTGCKGKGCDTGCKKNCDPPCKTRRCEPKPPPPPTCDAQCQLKKKIQKEKDELEQDAKTVRQPPPGNPVCATGNPLCPSNPSQPATVVTSGGDLTDETTAWSDQQYKNALNAAGSVIDASSTGTYNWFTASFGAGPSEFYPICGGSVSCSGSGGEGAIPEPPVGLIEILWKTTIVGGLLAAVAHNSGSGESSSSSSDNSGAAAQPPDDGDCAPPRQCFRGARGNEQPTFVPRPNDYKVDPKTGFVKDTHGVSVFDNAGKLTSKGFVPYEVDQGSIPDTLRIIQRGVTNPDHYEIVPRPGANLTPERYAEELAKIKVR